MVAGRNELAERVTVVAFRRPRGAHSDARKCGLVRSERGAARRGWGELSPHEQKHQREESDVDRQSHEKRLLHVDQRDSVREVVETRSEPPARSRPAASILAWEHFPRGSESGRGPGEIAGGNWRIRRAYWRVRRHGWVPAEPAGAIGTHEASDPADGWPLADVLRSVRESPSVTR